MNVNECKRHFQFDLLNFLIKNEVGNVTPASVLKILIRTNERSDYDKTVQVKRAIHHCVMLPQNKCFLS